MGSREEQNKTLVYSWYKKTLGECNTNSVLEGIDKYFSSDFIDYEAPPGRPPGTQGLKHQIPMTIAAFPDAKVTLEHVVAEDELVATVERIRGIHKGKL